MKIAAGGSGLGYIWSSKPESIQLGVYLLYQRKDELYQLLSYTIYTHHVYLYTGWKNRKTPQAQIRRTRASGSHKSTPV